MLRDASGRIVAEVSEFLGENTNNFAEYMGLIIGLEAAAGRGAKRIIIRADSELVVRQIEGRYKVKAQNLIPLFHRAIRLMAGFEAARIEHVPREQNKEADRLANKALDRAML